MTTITNGLGETKLILSAKPIASGTPKAAAALFVTSSVMHMTTTKRLVGTKAFGKPASKMSLARDEANPDFWMAVESPSAEPMSVRSRQSTILLTSVALTQPANTKTTDNVTATRTIGATPQTVKPRPARKSTSGAMSHKLGAGGSSATFMTSKKSDCGRVVPVGAKTIRTSPARNTAAS
eukprot:CAMPEP_0115663740 /NCGR_PEP_ID=MMETSP0272-20121206/48004_1 /TAXON_ID=71861 /ORGANISM="Scrippsiella trochoidea, Strain CCMP3099" /LENGTH=179 /DNA_ID=CAMNT_0003102113 /DNA_START=512 /DNA_END=1051 /DNA_ORIENTATION=-